jgi:hypothetical protein
LTKPERSRQLTIYSRQSKGYQSKQSLDDSTAVVRSWVAPVASPPVIRQPAFMLGGRFAVVREPHFMLGVAPGAADQAAGKPALSVVGASDESAHGK